MSNATDTNPNSKAREKFSSLGIDYLTEYRKVAGTYNLIFNAFFRNAIEEGFIGITLKEASSVDLLSRKHDIFIAITDDLCRYSAYHDVSFLEDRSLDISAPTRASYFIKWIISMKPLVIDMFIEASSYKYHSLLIEKESIFKQEDYDTFVRDNFMQNCNEFLSLHFACYFITGELKIGEFLENLEPKKEFMPLLYNLKYRVNHQDVYHLFLNNLLHNHLKL